MIFLHKKHLADDVVWILKNLKQWSNHIPKNDFPKTIKQYKCLIKLVKMMYKRWSIGGCKRSLKKSLKRMYIVRIFDL